MMIKRLNGTDNTFVVIQPDADDPGWFASVAVRDEGGFEVEFRDTGFREHELTAQSDVGKIARDVTIWLAARVIPGQPLRLDYNTLVAVSSCL
jgi:hypothetical protein